MKPRGFELVQPILVPRAGTHEEIITAVGLASLVAHLDDRDNPVWHRWLTAAPAKSVRRVKAPSHIAQVLQWAQEQGVAHAQVGGVLALAPFSYAEMPKRVRGSQVDGIDYGREDTCALPAHHATVEVITLESLTTGKAAAQVAHAVWGWHRKVPGWNPVTGIKLSFTTTAGLARAAEGDRAVRVHDGGFTEVAPGTMTAVALPLRHRH